MTTSGHDRAHDHEPPSLSRLLSSRSRVAVKLHAARAHGHEPLRAALASAWDCGDYPPNPKGASSLSWNVDGGAVRRHVRLRGFYWNGWSKGCGNASRGTTFEPGAGDSFYLTPSVAACRTCSRCMCPAYVFYPAEEPSEAAGAAVMGGGCSPRGRRRRCPQTLHKLGARKMSAGLPSRA